MHEENQIKELITQALTLRNKINQYGGAEENPVLWLRYQSLKSDILFAFKLPPLSVFQNIIDNPSVLDFPLLKLTVARFQRAGYVRKLNEVLADIGIPALSSPDYSEICQYEKEATTVYNELRIKSKEFADSKNLTYKQIFEGNMDGDLTIEDALWLSGYQDNAYSRFLIQVLYAGGYINRKQLERELFHCHRNGGNRRRFFHLLLSSKFVIQRQEAAFVLEELFEFRFANEFLRWQQCGFDLWFKKEN